MHTFINRGKNMYVWGGIKQKNIHPCDTTIYFSPLKNSSLFNLAYFFLYIYMNTPYIQITTIIATIIILFPSPERKFISDEFKTCKYIVQYGYHLVSRIHFILICIRIRGSTSGNSGSGSDS